VQTWVVHKITKSLEKQLGTEIEIDKVDVDFFKTVVLDGVYIEDLQRDTLLYAKVLKADIGLFSLFGKEFAIEELSIDGANIRLYKVDASAPQNFQFLIDAFTPDPSIPKSTSKPWTFDLEDFRVTDSRFQVIDVAQGSDIDARIGDLVISIDLLDLDKEILEVGKIGLSDSRIDIQADSAIVTTSPDTEVLAEQLKNEFPTIPWQISITEIAMVNNELSYHTVAPKLNVPNNLDPNHIDLLSVDIELRDLSWIDKNIQADIQNIDFTTPAQLFELNKFTGSISLDTSVASIRNLRVETSNSIVDGDFELSYTTFDDLISFDPSVELTSTFRSSTVSERDLRYLSPQLSKIIVIGPNENIKIRGKLDGTLAAVDLDKFNINVANQLKLDATGKIKNLANINRLSFDVIIQSLSTSYRDLKQLLPRVQLPVALNELGRVTLSSQFSGSLNNLTVRDARLLSQSPTSFIGGGSIQGLMRSDQPIAFNLRIDSLRTQMGDWGAYINVRDTQILNDLGIVNYTGDAKGVGTDYTLDGLASTAIGNLKADVHINFTEDYTDAKYDGELYLMDFDLSKVVPDTAQFGLATIYFIGQGEGLNLSDLTANMEAVVEKLDFNNYRYEYLNIEGDFANSKFEGYANFEDDNAEFEFAGLINFENELPEFDFKVNVDTINFFPLNFTSYPLGVQTRAQINFTGTNLANIDGSIYFRDLIVADSSFTLIEDSLSLVAESIRPDSSILIISAKFLNARVLGNFDLDLLPVVSQYYINDFISLNLDTVLTIDQKERIQDQEFTFDIRLEDSRPMSLIGLKEAEIVQRGQLDGAFNYDQNSLDLEGMLIQPRFKGLASDTLTIIADGSERRLKSSIIATNLTGLGFNLPTAAVSTRLVKDSLSLGLDFTGSEGQKILLMNGIATANTDDYNFVFDQNIILNDTSWMIDRQNAVHFSQSSLFIDQFNLSKNDGRLSVQSQGNYSSAVSPDIDIEFSEFRLNNFLSFVLDDQNNIEGNINGRATIAEPMSNANFKADLGIAKLRANNESLGNLTVSVAQDPNKPLLNINAQLIDDQKTFGAKGTYNTSEKLFDVGGSLDNFDLVLLAPFLAKSISELEGRVTGKYTLKGTADKPNFYSDLLLENVHTVIDFLNAEINIASTEVHVDKSLIDLGRIEITGTDDKQAVLYGVIFHDYFQDFDMNLEFQSTDFQLMNTTSDQNDLFWGTLNLNTAVSLTGSFNRPVIDIDAVTLDNSTFTFQVISDADAIGQVDYIIFANPAQLDSVELKRIEEQLILANRLKLDLTINLDVTQAAEATIILDPISGDRIVGRGNASLVIKMSPAGDVTMIGAYDIVSGAYKFSYGQFVNKTFALEENSRVLFSGDPLKSQLDITASYSSETSPLDLISNETTLSTQENTALKRQTEVKTMLLLKGDLEKPDITFDIDLPNNDGNILNSAISRKLVELRADPAEMNKQVFSLLLFNSFFPSTSAGNLLVGQGENIALSSVSNLITNQLNNLADKLVKGVEINIDLNSYQTQNTLNGNREVLSELEVGLSKTLFNDRVKVSAGTNIGLNATENQGLSNIAGDFVLEYRLSESGKYLLKVFRKSDFDILKDENTARNGIGFSAKRTFGKPGKKKQ